MNQFTITLAIWDTLKAALPEAIGGGAVAAAAITYAAWNDRRNKRLAREDALSAIKARACAVKSFTSQLLNANGESNLRCPAPSLVAVIRATEAFHGQMDFEAAAAEIEQCGGEVETLLQRLVSETTGVAHAMHEQEGEVEAVRKSIRSSAEKLGAITEDLIRHVERAQSPGAPAQWLRQ